MKKINVAVIGCGFIAETAHIPNCVSLPEANLVAIVDQNSERLKFFKNKYGIINAFKTYHPVLENEDIDAVIVSTPSSTHKEISIDAAKTGRTVEGLIPVNVPPTPEYAKQLESRLTFLDKKILIYYTDDLRQKQ